MKAYSRLKSVTLLNLCIFAIGCSIGPRIDYVNYLESLEKSNPVSIGKAVQALQKEGHKVKRSEFITFYKFYEEAIESISKRGVLIDGTPLDDFLSKVCEGPCNVAKGIMAQNLKIRSVTQMRILYENGIDVYISEGESFLDKRPFFINENFSNALPEDIRDFFILHDMELIQRYQDDAALLIGFDEVAQRALRWEEYIRSHPNASYIDRAKSFYDVYLSALLFGLPNSWTFDYDSHRLHDNVLKIYKKCIKEHANSHTSKILKSYLSQLESCNYVWCDKLRDFAIRNNIKCYVRASTNSLE